VEGKEKATGFISPVLGKWVMVQGIADYRSENDPSRRIEELFKVGGGGPATFEQIEDFITVSD
jgi:hypothetical protein